MQNISDLNNGLKQRKKIKENIANSESKQNNLDISHTNLFSLKEGSANLKKRPEESTCKT